MRSPLISRQRSRAVHTLDVENLLGGHVTLPRVAALWQAYTTQVQVQPTDAVFAGFGPATARSAFAMPDRVRILVGPHCPDSADIALATIMEPTFVAGRYGRVFIGSGDHYFATAALGLRQAGAHVVAVLGEGLVAAALYAACSDSLRLTPLTTPLPAPPPRGRCAAA